MPSKALHPPAFVDFYMCGFPCKPFGQTVHLPEEKAHVFSRHLKTIETRDHKPPVFILENFNGF